MQTTMIKTDILREKMARWVVNDHFGDSITDEAAKLATIWAEEGTSINDIEVRLEVMEEEAMEAWAEQEAAYELEMATAQRYKVEQNPYTGEYQFGSEEEENQYWAERHFWENM